MKHLAYLLITIFLLEGCSQGDIATDPLPEGVIGFSDGLLTRGMPLENADGILSMGVFCGLTDGSFTESSLPDNYMNNVSVSRISTSASFTYAPLKYWPTDVDKRLSFFAYAPHSATLPQGALAFAATGGTPSLTYTVPTDVTRQPDLMVALPKTDLTKAVGAISFEMKHVLSCIGFKVAGDGYKVTGIKIVGAVNSGTRTMNGGVADWNLSTTTGEFSAGIRFDSDKNYHTTTTTMTDILRTDGYLMMIPQTLPAGAKIVMTFEGRNNLEFPLNATTWAIGQKMVYNISIKARPEFTVTIGEWIPGTNDQVDY